MKKRIAAWFAAMMLAVSAIPAGALEITTFAASSDDDETFDGHKLTDKVPSHYFDADTELDEELEKKMKSIFGSNLDNVTYKTLQSKTSLDLSGLQLESLPVELMSYMPNLRTLNLSDNYLENDDLREVVSDQLTKLNNINLSGNYLTAIPSWVVSSDASTKNLSGNFIPGYEPRTIMVTTETYYFSDGDPIDVEDFEEKILESVRFGDGTEIPDFWLESAGGDYEDEDFLDADLTAFLNAAGLSEDDSDSEVSYKSDKSTVVDIPVKLGKFAETKVRIYLMNGTDLSSVKMLLSALVNETLSADVKYTDTSKKNYESAKTVAKAVYDSGAEDFDIYKNAFDLLNRARKNLTEVAGTELMNAVNAYITDSKNYPEANYTTSSYSTFQSALDELNDIKKNSKDATPKQVEDAIKRYQNALSGLVSTSVSVPKNIPKSEFERIFGTSSAVERINGSTRNSVKYGWKFVGTNITAPADFNPEINDGDTAVEESVLLEAGSLDSFFLFGTVQTAAFPGKGTLTVQFKKDIPTGKAYIYKWDNSAKKGTLVGETTIAEYTDTSNLYNRTASIELTEGGTYYLSPKLNNFPIKSEEFTVDDVNKTVKLPAALSRTAAQLREGMEFGKYLTILGANGNAVADNAVIISGMTVNAPNGDKYSLIILGDANNDGRYSLDDIDVMINRYATVTFKTDELTRCDFNSDGRITLEDIDAAVKSYVNMFAGI